MPELSFEPVYRTDVYTEQRGLEQMLYDRYPSAALNKIRPINLSNANFGELALHNTQVGT